MSAMLCPACGITAPPIEHLIDEYKVGMRACFHKIFGKAACDVQNRVARALYAAGVNEIPNIFGPVAVRDTWGQDTATST